MVLSRRQFWTTICLSEIGGASTRATEQRRGAFHGNERSVSAERTNAKLGAVADARKRSKYAAIRIESAAAAPGTSTHAAPTAASPDGQLGTADRLDGTGPHRICRGLAPLATRVSP